MSKKKAVKKVPFNYDKLFVLSFIGIIIMTLGTFFAWRYFTAHQKKQVNRYQTYESCMADISVLKSKGETINFECDKEGNKKYVEDVKKSDVGKSTPVTTQSNPSPQSSTKNSAQTPAVSPSNVTPEVKKTCEVAWDVPFKKFFKSGTGPYTPGSLGMSETCSYSDGRPKTREVVIQPEDQINYINVTSADYNSAYGVCSSSFSGSDIDECMKIVWQP